MKLKYYLIWMLVFAMSMFILSCVSLHDAAMKGNISRVKKLLDQGANINAKRSKDDRTPLHLASMYNNKAMVEFLIANGANVTAKDKYGDTPRAKYQTKRYDDIVDILAQAEGLVWTLHEAVKEGNIYRVKRFIDDGADVNMNDKEGNTPLHRIVFCCGLFLDQKRGVIIELLIKHGADINMINTQTGQTPLHIAAYRADKDLVERLIDYGANISAVESGGQTPLHFAVSDRDYSSYGAKKRMEVVELLIERGAVINARDTDNATPLHNAALSDFFGIGWLIDHGADVNAKDLKGNTPLHMARGRSTTDLLILKGADVNTTNNKGETPKIPIDPTFTTIIPSWPIACTAVFDKNSFDLIGGSMLYGGTRSIENKRNDPDLHGFRRVEHNCSQNFNFFEMLKKLMPNIPNREARTKIIFRMITEAANSELDIDLR